MDTAQPPQPINPSPHTPLQPNDNGILVGAPPPLSAQPNSQPQLSNGAGHSKRPTHLMLLGLSQLAITAIYAQFGIPYMEKLYTTLRMTVDQSTPMMVAAVTGLVAIIVLTAGVAGKKLLRLQQHPLYQNGGWILLVIGITVLSVFIAYVFRTLFIPMTYLRL